MKPRQNRFRQKLRIGLPQFGLFCGSLAAQAADALGGCGFDFLMFDPGHTPVRVLARALAAAPASTQCLVRMPLVEPVSFQPVLDLGIDTVVVPNIRTAEEALAAVRTLECSANRICLLLQIDTAEGLVNLDAICAVAGVDGLFMAPVDLADDLGYPAQHAHPAVVEHSVAGLRRIRAAGKAAGILAPEAQAQMYLDAGASMVCLGTADRRDAQAGRRLQPEPARA